MIKATLATYVIINLAYIVVLLIYMRKDRNKKIYSIELEISETKNRLNLLETTIDHLRNKSFFPEISEVKNENQTELENVMLFGLEKNLAKNVAHSSKNVSAKKRHKRYPVFKNEKEK